MYESPLAHPLAAHPRKSYRKPGEKKLKLQVMCELVIRTWVLSGSASADLLVIRELMEHVITIEPPLL